MHWLRLIVFLAIPLMLAVAAPVLILWAWSNGLPLQPALLVGVLFIAVALIIHLSGQMLPAHEEEWHALWNELEQVRKHVAHVSTQTACPEKDDSPPLSRQTPTTGPSQPATAADAGDVPAASVSAPGSEGPFLRPRSGAGRDWRFVLYMEPVKDLADGATMLYRAQPAVQAADGSFFMGRNAALHARREGETAALQLSTLKRCGEFLRQLREHGFSLPVICPLDVRALGHAFNDEQVEPLLPTGELRTLLLLAVDLEDLRRAEHAARLQLIMLAQKAGGVVLDVREASAASLSLPAPLPVRFLDAPAAALVHDARTTGRSLLQQQLALRGWRLIAHDITDEQTLAQVRQLAPLGRGRHLGVPKRVKENPGAAVSGTPGGAQVGGTTETPTSAPSPLRMVARS